MLQYRGYRFCALGFGNNQKNKIKKNLNRNNTKTDHDYLDVLVLIYSLNLEPFPAIPFHSKNLDLQKYI